MAHGGGGSDSDGDNSKQEVGCEVSCVVLRDQEVFDLDLPNGTKLPRELKGTSTC